MEILFCFFFFLLFLHDIVFLCSLKKEKEKNSTDLCIFLKFMKVIKIAFLFNFYKCLETMLRNIGFSKNMHVANIIEYTSIYFKSFDQVKNITTTILLWIRVTDRVINNC